MKRVLCLIVPAVLLCACSTAPPKRMRPLPAPGQADTARVVSIMDLSSAPGFLAPKATHELRIHTIPVGAGSCHLIECPGNTAPIVYDCGSTTRTESSLDDEELSDFFSCILDQYTHDPIIIISHGDSDHYNLVNEALQGRDVMAIWMSGTRGDYIDGEHEFDNWLQGQESRGAAVKVGFPPGYSNGGQPVPELQCGDASTFIMTVNNGDETNTRSLVLRIEYGSFSIILAGDARKQTEEAAMTFPRVQTTVLTGSHHGATSHGSNHKDWAAATKPAVTIFSAGASYKHPKCKAMIQYLKTLKDEVAHHQIRCGKKNGLYTDQFWVDEAEYLTETNGIITVVTDGNEYTVRCSEQADCF